MKGSHWMLAALASCLMVGDLSAQITPPLRLTRAGFMDIDAQLMSAQGRPGEEWRIHGLKSHVSGRYDEAVQRFEHAAGYADKYSQHYLSLIYWHGQGVPVDRVLAYIWSDLAAERGSRKLLLIREKMWAELTADQRKQAVQRGAEYYARYGDDVAQPRAEREMRRFATNMTGSRVGFRNQKLETGGPPINGVFDVETGSNIAAYQVSLAGSPDELYGRDGGLKMLRDYWKAQDAQLEAGTGWVEVGPISVEPDAPR